MKKRLMKEMKMVEDNPKYNESIELQEENNLNKLIVNLPGPKGTKYENEIYEISFTIPKDYPFKEPIITLKLQLIIQYLINLKIIIEYLYSYFLWRRLVARYENSSYY